MPFNSAVIGLGGMGTWHVKSIQDKVSRIHVKGAYDIRPEALEKTASLGIKAYSSLDEVLSDPEIDLVTIAIPNDMHAPTAIRALRAGKNVVCEKPVTLNSAELQQILDVQKETGKLFSVHQNRRWDKDFCIVKEAKKQGLLGELTFVESKVQGSRGSMYGWRGYKRNGGGMLLDWGVHLIDQIMQLDPTKVVKVDSHLLSVYTPEVDDNIKLMLLFEDGMSAVLEMSTMCLIPSPRWHVEGTKGTLCIDDWSCKGEMYQLKQDAAMEWDEDIVYTEAGPTRTMAPRPKYTMNKIALPKVKADWSEYYNNIADVMEGKAELIVKPEQTMRVMKVIDLLFKASEEGHGFKCEI
ncbi:MAG: Gfo/Idh/MocA family oxidoreductase [Clostridia bacterium]|nr:Gfo/Idh/MocA family oxidoreductase [Clostridia bacterium]